MKNPRKYILEFIDNKKEYPILTFIAACLFPLLHYFNTHFYIVSSFKHLLFFTGIFLILPTMVFYAINQIIRKTSVFSAYHKFVLPLISFGLFAILIVLITVGIKKKLLLLVFVIAALLAILMYKSLKKVVVIQYILAIISFSILVSKCIERNTSSYKWVEQPDKIESVIFKKTPNIYVIQADGYPSFNEINKGYYNFDNSTFNSFLRSQEFKLYGDYRSNYESTLYSNSSLLAMKHHYYKVSSNAENETYDFGKVIIESNPVLTILKNNNYKTHLLIQEPYFVLGKSNLGFDYSNIMNEDVSYFSNGFDMNKDIKSDLMTLINANGASNNFYFIEKIKPWHVASSKSYSKGKKEERYLYLERLKEVNTWLTDVVSSIHEGDANSLVIIVADHGGYVGFDYQTQSRAKTLDRDLLYSVFGSALAVKWPNGDIPKYDNKIKTSVNLFRVLFSYLSDNEAYLDHLQDDKSYLIIEEKTPFGVYEVIDNEGNISFEKHK
ncbi:hypothetical protein [uncultured Psychroserpens sp.]|uniref:hypothetical protein n=1 Tax=uncultured Psychroserpens sp. TaxID=255436 RepID=UPI0026373B0F|nr:hypothetical protein [uncultured Psychroserpens sp.]